MAWPKGLKNPWGGRRAHPKPLFKRTYCIEQEMIDYIKKRGNGNNNRGLRIILNEAIGREREKEKKEFEKLEKGG